MPVHALRQLHFRAFLRAFATLSTAFSVTCLALPTAWSVLPSARRLSLPVNAPAASLSRPFTTSVFPLMTVPPVARRSLRKPSAKKADVQKRPEAFMRVGLLVNGSPERPGYPSSNHPTRRPDRFRYDPLTPNHRTPCRKGNANRAMAAPDRVSWKAWK